MGRWWIRALVAATVWSVALGGTVTANDGLSVTVAGKEISLGALRGLSCHDFDYPVLRCFASPRALEAEVDRRVRTKAVPRVVLAAGYVTAYEHASYAGSQVTLSTDQAWLSTIGWNDQISSFKSFGATGNFRENSPGSGFLYAYGSSAQVSFLSGTYNDKFSAFSID